MDGQFELRRIIGVWTLFLLFMLGVLGVSGSDQTLSTELCITAGNGFFRHQWQRITWMGNPIPLTVLTTGSAALALLLRRWVLAIWLIAIPYAASLTTNIAKEIFRRPRPIGACFWGQYADGWSFPSGHAAGATTGIALVTLTIVYDRRPSWIPIAGAFGVSSLISLSRVVLGVHYLSDVIAGQIWGTIWAFFGACLIRQSSGTQRSRTDIPAGADEP